MPVNDLEPIVPETPAISEVPPNEEGTEDFSQGYRVAIDVMPNGYIVSDPMPLPPTPQMEGEGLTPDDLVPDLTTALKHVLAVIKANPLGESDQENFAAGFDNETKNRGQRAVY